MFEAIILGIVQGITEFFPVSSTAHLIILPWFFTWSGVVDTLTFDVALHAGTLLALVVCFWKDWVTILKTRQRIFFLILLASVPAGLAGFFLKDLVETDLRSPYVICASLVIFGLVMLVSEKMFKFRRMDQMNGLDAMIIGLAQAVALVPGVSRSGITISAGLFRGLERETAARFSFLLSTPVIAGATLLHAGEIVTQGLTLHGEIFAAGFLAAAVTGIAAIKFLMRFFRRFSLNTFVYYRFFLALVIFAGIWLRP